MKGSKEKAVYNSIKNDMFLSLGGQWAVVHPGAGNLKLIEAHEMQQRHCRRTVSLVVGYTSWRRVVACYKTPHVSICFYLSPSG